MHVYCSDVFLGDHASLCCCAVHAGATADAPPPYFNNPAPQASQQQSVSWTDKQTTLGLTYVYVWFMYSTMNDKIFVYMAILSA